MITMFTKKLFKGIAIFVSSTIFSMSTIQSAYAAPGTLATAPLFLSTIVEPNVFMTLDDSGSMAWVTMVQEGTAGFTTSSGMPLLNGDRLGYWHPTWNEKLKPFAKTVPPSEKVAPRVTAWEDTWVFRTHHGNALYYNPSETYEPWPGAKADGSPMYIDAVETKVLQDPDDPSGNWVDLTQRLNYGSYNNALYLPSYYIWNDDGDGILETTDSKTLVEIPAGTAAMQNFANWFQYYRSRMNTTKAVIGQTINNTDSSRIGLDVFNNGLQKDSKSMSDTTNKRELLEEFYGTEEETYTPARSALKRVGEYFKTTGSNAPILTAGLGGECQQNFNILLTDGFWNRSSPSVGNTDIDGGSGNNNTEFDGNAAQSNDGGNYADSYSDTLADVAMKYYEEDLRTDLTNSVPTQTGVDEADHQHLVTYAVALGVTGTLDPTVADPLAVGFNWPQPVSDTSTTVDDLWHASYNGRGKFLSAKDRGTLATSLSAAIADIAERTATAAAVSINSAKLTTQSVVYLAQFNTNGWQGNLFAYKIADLDTGELSATPEWTAADELNSRNITTNPRTILTHDGTKGVAFQWDDLSSAQQADLKTSPSGGTDSDTIGKARLNYLRGDQSDEGTGNFFRERLSLLSDLVNSGPVYVGAPNLRWPDTAPFPTTAGVRYSDFKNGSAASRAGMVYAGSNGGMLHGFAEADGEERLAYIANNLFSTTSGEGLHYLTDQNYVHSYYNDLTPTVSDIYANTGSGTKWQTVLISGQRGGGRGIFALDVTDPAAFTETNASGVVLWEFTNSDDPDLGYTYSRPQVGMANDGSWVAIFGNGYNDTGDGESKLFIVDIAKGADGSWSTGDYIEISTNSGSSTDRNGLATPALADLDGNGTIDRVYAGDLKGQMWAFDLSSTNPAAWGIPGGDPLFTTKGDQPITSKPTLSKHPTISDNGSNDPNVMVFFGSGQYLVDADKTSTDDNYFYGVWDKGDDNLDDGDLIEQTYDSNFSERVLTHNTIDYYNGTDHGWFFELPDNGERSVTNPVVRGSLVFFNSFVPVSDPCSVGGYGYRFAVNLIDGSSPDEAAVDTNDDGLVDDNDKTDDGSGNTETIAAIQQEGFLPEPVFIEDIAYTAEKPSKVKELPSPPTGRFGWQELLQ
jgi:type IV pilus assembly protein PilY1